LNSSIENVPRKRDGTLYGGEQTGVTHVIRAGSNELLKYPAMKLGLTSQLLRIETKRIVYE